MEYPEQRRLQQISNKSIVGKQYRLQQQVLMQNLTEGIDAAKVPANPNSNSSSYGSKVAIIVTVSIVSSLILIIVAAIWVNFIHKRRLRLIHEKQNKVFPLNTKAGDTLNTENQTEEQKQEEQAEDDKNVHPTVLAFERSLQKKIQELIKLHPEFEEAKKTATSQQLNALHLPLSLKKINTPANISPGHQAAKQYSSKEGDLKIEEFELSGRKQSSKGRKESDRHLLQVASKKSKHQIYGQTSFKFDLDRQSLPDFDKEILRDQDNFQNSLKKENAAVDEYGNVIIDKYSLSQASFRRIYSNKNKEANQYNGTNQDTIDTHSKESKNSSQVIVADDVPPLGTISGKSKFVNHQITDPHKRFTGNFKSGIVSYNSQQKLIYQK
ncbi:hypothetical protein FGO68_gene9494 [Halteria grandinella]|uniref:Transmembrane protein n=1 Tax=Halteria grandinella TaxID=5974 RepID=A0A8J8NNV3_HALGN|nr:hypothetical protein FGO68_gene9494 [Halteria grandinella]